MVVRRDVSGVKGEMLGELQHGHLLGSETGVPIVGAELTRQLRFGVRPTQSLCVSYRSIPALV